MPTYSVPPAVLDALPRAYWTTRHEVRRFAVLRRHIEAHGYAVVTLADLEAARARREARLA